MVDNCIIIAGIIAITLLECFFLYTGHNGIMFSSVLALIAGITGLAIPSPLFLRGKNDNKKL